MFKSWAIFVFTLIPLALVFAGVVGGSFGGADTEREVFPTPAPPGTPVAAPTPAPGTTVIQLVARSNLWDRRALTAAANQPVVIQMDNQDAGVLHNFSLYRDQTRSQNLFRGELVTGPAVHNYEFDAPAPGTYFFICDVHPDTMTGSFTTN